MCARKLGRQKEILFSGGASPNSEATTWDYLYGNQQVSSNFSEQYQDVVQEKEFQIGRTGGPGNNFMCDAFLIRSGEPFSNGRNYLRLVFNQRR
jgi:hypothetical protein